VAAFAAVDGSGRVVWQADGRDGESVIRAAGATEGEAWPGALDQARSLGMLGRGGAQPSARWPSRWNTAAVNRSLSIIQIDPSALELADHRR